MVSQIFHFHPQKLGKWFPIWRAHIFFKVGGDDPPTRITGNNHHHGQVSNLCRQISVDLELKLMPDYYAKWWKDASWTERKSMLVGVDWAKKRVPQFSNSKILGSDSIDKSHHLFSLDKNRLGWRYPNEKTWYVICMYDLFVARYTSHRKFIRFSIGKSGKPTPRTEGKNFRWMSWRHDHPGWGWRSQEKGRKFSKAKWKDEGVMEGDFWSDESSASLIQICGWMWMSVWIFFVGNKRGGRFCWSVKIGVIHVTTCNPADREWRSLNELNINQVNVNCEEGQKMAALSMITVVLRIFDSFHFCRIRTRHQQIRPRTDLWVIGIFFLKFLGCLKGVFRWISAVFEMFSHHRSSLGAGASLWRRCPTTHYPHRCGAKKSWRESIFLLGGMTCNVNSQTRFCSTWHVYMVIYVYNICTSM